MLPITAVACGGKSASTNVASPATATTPKTPAERAALVTSMMARELSPAGVQRVELIDGLVSGELESKKPLRPECSKDDDGDTHCKLVADWGDDDEIGCSVLHGILPFGVLAKKTLEDSELTETPVLETKQIGEGIASSFVSNIEEEDETNVYVGTVKLAALYAHGYMAVCHDRKAGARKSFARVVDRFFASLKFKDYPTRNTLFSLGYQTRVGDRTTGLQYRSFLKHEEEGHLMESSLETWLETDGKSWSIRDDIEIVERDQQGKVETIHDIHWMDGKEIALSAKSSEDKRFRLKLDVGEKSNSLESTPKAPINTELGAAPDLAKVVSGVSPNYRYAFLGVDDGDPEFHYVTLTRASAGVLLEEEEGNGKKRDRSSDKPKPKDELHVNSAGIVTKEVSSRSVRELVHTWGTMPRAFSSATKATTNAASAKDAAGKKNQPKRK